MLLSAADHSLWRDSLSRAGRKGAMGARMREWESWGAWGAMFPWRPVRENRRQLYDLFDVVWTMVICVLPSLSDELAVMVTITCS